MNTDLCTYRRARRQWLALPPIQRTEGAFARLLETPNEQRPH